MSAGATGTDAFTQCVSSLKPMCSYDQKEVGCSSLITTQIPLSAGGTWGNNEIKGGPYGAFVEWNQGKDFANPINSSESSCDVLAATFGEPEKVTADVLDLRGGDLALYTIFRPGCMKDGETYPVITWGNGTCGQSGGYAAMLATLASHGFVVIAANSRFTDAGNNEMLRALDLAKALNEKEGSSLYHKLNLEKVGAMGHSQGSSATAHAATDPRIKAVILWNGGLTADKPFLAVSGDRDIGGYTPQQMDSAVQSASQPGAYLYYHKVLETGGNVTGHLTLMEQPERVWEPTVAWWKYILNGDQEAKKMFVGADCGLCNMKDEYEFGVNAKLP
jgi:pimeloyl-ACP methyl ester carboxylesterase